MSSRLPVKNNFDHWILRFGNVLQKNWNGLPHGKILWIFAERLTGPYAGLWRFRIGDYRVICDVLDGRIRVLRVLSVKHRSQVYRDIL